MICVVLWPPVVVIGTIVYLKSKFNITKNTVLLKGSRSAKTYRARTED